MEYSIDSFIDRVLFEKGLVGVSEEVMTQLRSDLVARIEDLINAEIIAHLPEDLLPEFENKLDSSSDEDIQSFCQSHIKDFDGLIAGVFVKFRRMYLEGS